MSEEDRMPSLEITVLKLLTKTSRLMIDIVVLLGKKYYPHRLIVIRYGLRNIDQKNKEKI